MKLYLVHRVLKFSNDAQLSINVAVYEDRASALKAKEEMQGLLASVLRCELVKMSGDEGTPVGITTGDYLNRLGVVAFNHFVVETETAPTVDFVEKRGGIILPS